MGACHQPILFLLIISVLGIFGIVIRLLSLIVILFQITFLHY
jgi:hypothetical protein